MRVCYLFIMVADFCHAVPASRRADTARRSVSIVPRRIGVSTRVIRNWKETQPGSKATACIHYLLCHFEYAQEEQLYTVGFGASYRRAGISPSCKISRIMPRRYTGHGRKATILHRIILNFLSRPIGEKFTSYKTPLTYSL